MWMCWWSLILEFKTFARALISLEAILGIVVSVLFLNSLAMKISRGS